jgi:hypothetical protein
MKNEWAMSNASLLFSTYFSFEQKLNLEPSQCRFLACFLEKNICAIWSSKGERIRLDKLREINYGWHHAATFAAVVAH